jgi:hypothetical protein
MDQYEQCSDQQKLQQGMRVKDINHHCCEALDPRQVHTIKATSPTIATNETGFFPNKVSYLGMLL